MEFISVKTIEQAAVVEDLAREIWNEHYAAILEQAQIDYMLDKFQSKEVIFNELCESYYCLISENSDFIGYIGYSIKEHHLFLSKIYLKSSSRGKGYGKKAFQFVENIAKSKNLQKIMLTINKNNTKSINIYIKMGFYSVDSVVKDIGGGFYMDDYVLQKDL